MYSDFNQVGAYSDDSTDAGEAIKMLSNNRVLITLPLTATPEDEAKIVEQLTTIQDVFRYYKPSIEIDFVHEDGSTTHEVIEFEKVSDFSTKGIVDKSKFLKELNAKKENLQLISNQLLTNKQLQAILADKEAREAYLAVIQALSREIEKAGSK